MVVVKRFAIRVEYDGTDYSGWQIQANATTIQERLEDALKEITRQEIRIVGAGRTDSGVHARGQVAHFDVNDVKLEPVNITGGMNANLPDDIVVRETWEVDGQFHARHDAVSRDYIYTISLQQHAIGRQYCWFVYNDLDFHTLQEAERLVLGEHDFRSFMHAQSDTEDTICNITKSTWKSEEDTYRYGISGNRFLHNMVRCLVGTMVEVARGRYTVQDFRDYIQQPDKEAPVVSAPAKGLVLDRVHYDTSVETVEI